MLFRRSRSRSREKRSRSATPERKAPVNAEGAITIKDEPLDKVTRHSCLTVSVLSVLRLPWKPLALLLFSGCFPGEPGSADCSSGPRPSSFSGREFLGISGMWFLLVGCFFSAIQPLVSSTEGNTKH